jgi:type IX secretion system substrate protein
MKRIYILAFLLMFSVVMFAATVAHPVIIEVQEDDGDIPADVLIEAWMMSNPDEILTEATYDVYFHTDGYVHIQCGQFEEWNEGDILHVELTATNGAQGEEDYTLNYDNFQFYSLPATGIILTGGVDELAFSNVFNAGWNLWSINIQLADYAVEYVFASLNYLTKVKSITQSYDPELGAGFNTLTELQDGYGYWVQVSALDSLELEGEAIDPATTEISIDAGWNLVAYLPQDSQAPVDAFASLITAGYLEKVKSITQSYDPDLGAGFNTLASMESGNGYWVNLNTAVADFTYPIPTGRNVTDAADKEYVWTPVIYTNSTCAYGATTATDGYVGAFVDGECRGIADVIDGTLSFVINGEDVENVNFQLYNDGKISAGDVSVTTAPGEDVSDFAVDFRSEAPAVTSLSSIYPNPFNPETTVAFDLAISGKVDLAVYNIKGQKVAELVNETLSAGEHQIVWQAAGKSSGVYFIKLSTESVNQTRKVILMK